MFLRQSAPETGGHRAAEKEEATRRMQPKQASQPKTGSPLRASRHPGRHGVPGGGERAGGSTHGLLSVPAVTVTLPLRRKFATKHRLFAHCGLLCFIFAVFLSFGLFISLLGFSLKKSRSRASPYPRVTISISNPPLEAVLPLGWMLQGLCRGPIDHEGNESAQLLLGFLVAAACFSQVFPEQYLLR